MHSNQQIPRGIEVLVKKVSVDAVFCDTLLTTRAAAADQIGLKLDAAESAMLTVIPEAQLIGIIQNTKVSLKARPVFMGYAAAAMLIAIGSQTSWAFTNDDTTSEVEDTDSPEADSGGSIRDLDGLVSGIGTGCRPDSVNGRGSGLDNEGLNTTVKLTSNCDSVTGPGASDVSRSPGAINAIISGHLAGIKNLYNSEMKKNPDIPDGKIVVWFTILADGSVGDSETVSDSIEVNTLRSGIHTRVSSWKFLSASDEVTVVVPFVFVVTG